MKKGGLLVAVCGLVLMGSTQMAFAEFGMKQVVQQARQLAQAPYKAPDEVPASLLNLSYDDFRQIRFDPVNMLWHQSQGNFQVMLTAPGKFFRYPVQINVVDAAGAHRVDFHKEWFSWPSGFAEKVPDDLGYAGFRLTYPLNQPDAQNQFLSFAGASYFRGVARGENFGLSARGIAIDTGLASGEEFPNFTEFWLVRPSPDAHAIKFYALLDGPSLTGAYQFVVFPGAPLRIEVHARLFVRQSIELLGLAPLTSMFFYGANTPRPVAKWRPQVHDSDGLLIHSGTSEWLWRPLINPPTLQMNYFVTNSPKGFGLLQREQSFSAYEDAEARYDNRPSAWVVPHGDWGKGHVVLTEIPTNAETNDNIVAFWSPSDKAEAGDTYNLHYTLYFGDPTISRNPMARVVATYVGMGASATAVEPDAGSYRIQVDFAPNDLASGDVAEISSDTPVQAVVTGLDDTQVLHQTVRWLPVAKVWRLSILAKPAKGQSTMLRAYLKSGQSTLSETWSYTLPADNRFTHAKR